MTTDSASIKRRLCNHRKKVQDCDALRTELDFAKEKYGDVRSVVYDAVTGGHGSQAESSVERQAYGVIELEEKIAKNEAARIKDWQEIEPLLIILKPIESLIVRLRYYHAAEWSDICQRIYGKKKNYELDEGMYLNKTFKNHGRALIALTKMKKQK